MLRKFGLFEGEFGKRPEKGEHSRESWMRYLLMNRGTQQLVECGDLFPQLSRRFFHRSFRSSGQLHGKPVQMMKDGF